MINWSQKWFTFYSRLDRSIIIMYHHKLYLLLVILVVSCHAAYEETSRFLTDSGFGHVIPQGQQELSTQYEAITQPLVAMFCLR